MKNGFRVGASLQSFVALSKSAHSRLEKPYGNCTEDGFAVAEYYGNYTYTLQSCQHACLQRMASEKCGCVDPLYPKIANQTLCSRVIMLCLITLTNDISSANSVDGNTMCECLSPCVNSVYDKTITNSIFPSVKYKDATGTQAQRGILLGEQGGGRQGGGSDDSDDYENRIDDVFGINDLNFVDYSEVFFFFLNINDDYNEASIMLVQGAAHVSKDISNEYRLVQNEQQKAKRFSKSNT
ncbi:hypothetical protein PRIPAC_80591 [Pristionchus pacificus]|uniref:Ion channel n=1 Tax=Pristionchus pacificus TaxID=54126 RepID=A0A2A6C2E0_PRIPA|nr:hypothetical protein PRIPAC_80591 [Pristionchus pacificus]|eukprot:PDM72193.1 ion channel [Pristionchus pacificus]